MKYNISKELFEAVIGYDYKSIEIKKNVIKAYYLNIKGNCEININDFFFKCIDFVNTKGYVFVQDSRGLSTIQKISTRETKCWEAEEFNKQRLFDSCQWILEKENND